jgi:hypothetical protein
MKDIAADVIQSVTSRLLMEEHTLQVIPPKDSL